MDLDGDSPAPPPGTRRILGVDPGLNVTGYGVLDAENRRFRLHEAGIIRGGSARDLGRRVAQIYEGLCEVIEQNRPQAIAIEELFSHYERPRTAILMGHARGVICLAAANNQIPIVGYSATQVKKILTGSGRAPKTQIQQAVQRELRLEQIPEPNDVADALAIAMCHGYLGDHQGPRVEATPTAPKRRASPKRRADQASPATKSQEAATTARDRRRGGSQNQTRKP